MTFHTDGMKANLRKALLPATILALGTTILGGCVGSRMIPDPAGAPPPQAPAPSAPRPTPGPNVTPGAVATPGDWQWSVSGGASTARFAEGRLVLRCDLPSRTILIERNEPRVAHSGPVTLTIAAPPVTRSFQAAARNGTVTLSLPARDPLLDAMAFSKGRFSVLATGLPPLTVPSWTEVSRVIEDCR